MSEMLDKLPPNLFSIGIQVMLAILLIVAILYCSRLDAKLKSLRSGRDRMLEAAQELAQSVAQAQAAIVGLRASADAAGRDLQHKIDEARAVAQMPQQRETSSASSDFSLRRRSAS